jgi:hypothetical protein
MKCTVEIGLGAMIYIWSFRHSNVDGEGGETDRKEIA